MYFSPHPTFSLEVVAPATTTEREQLSKALATKLKAHPAFISLTAGSKPSQHQNSLILADFIQTELQLPIMAHLTGLYHSKTEVSHILTELTAYHINDLLILRGDYRKNQPPVGDFAHASDLAQFVTQQGNFRLTGACYPEKHPESRNFTAELANLKIKIASGVEQLITQIVFDNQTFYEFQARLQAAGVEYAINQIHDIVDHGVQGIHLYSMNNLENTNKIWNSTHNLFNQASNHELKRL